MRSKSLGRRVAMGWALAVWVALGSGCGDDGGVTPSPDGAPRDVAADGADVRASDAGFDAGFDVDPAVEACIGRDGGVCASCAAGFFLCNGA